MVSCIINLCESEDLEQRDGIAQSQCQVACQRYA